MAYHLRFDVREGSTNRLKIRKHHDRRERDEYPRPRPDCVVRDLEQQHGADGVALITSRKHPLRNVTTATRFRTRVPDAPPLDGERNNKDGQGHLHVGEIRDEAELCYDVGVGKQVLQSVHLRQTERHRRGQDGASHRNHEQDEVGQHDTEKSAECAEYERDSSCDEERLNWRESKHDRGNLDGRE